MLSACRPQSLLQLPHRQQPKCQRVDVTPADHISGDVFDDAVAAAVRHFQSRHGLPETGSVGPATLAALNVPVGKRLHQLAASIDRLAAMDVTFGERYVVVNLPSTVAEAVEGDHVKAVAVKIGICDDNYWEITDGLTNDQEIVSGGYRAIGRDLQDGSKIHVGPAGADAEADKK